VHRLPSEPQQHGVPEITCNSLSIFYTIFAAVAVWMSHVKRILFTLGASPRSWSCTPESKALRQNCATDSPKPRLCGSARRLTNTCDATGAVQSRLSASSTLTRRRVEYAIPQMRKRIRSTRSSNLDAASATVLVVVDTGYMRGRVSNSFPDEQYHVTRLSADMQYGKRPRGFLNSSRCQIGSCSKHRQIWWQYCTGT
jgi:hypothetical protein